ncbi:hypothetical protein CYMTET_28215 [Cymbomonas tetramitiformis]|uniref:Uncharacterized protein n=1 Tax=Cymbomonas tetramitiformis TaxID=36881 RepID=A0AAE0FPT3_9CHLO|nr:hypothetical protein CYMTET_28215 [Cymbomonas tetramitiformis]
MAFGKKKFAPPVGEWKRQETGGRYLTWEGPTTSAGRSAAPHRMASIGGGCPARSLSSGARAPSAGSFPAAGRGSHDRALVHARSHIYCYLPPRRGLRRWWWCSSANFILHLCDLDDDDADWPAFRESPAWTPSIGRNNYGSTVAGLRAPPPGGAE